MTAEQWTSVRRLLDAALDNPGARAALLADLRGRDPEVCDELERLLADLEHDEGVSAGLSASGLELTDQTVGPYAIVREIGRGGAATVVLAVREEGDTRMEVALKLLRTDFLRGVPRRAFQRELRVLARLNHPHIARLLDWGTIAGGLVYLAIEYVDGRSITDYCAQNRLDLAARLTLFQQVCAAVEHAHRNLVVHRDLKPSNILVTGSNVKLLDFGIATELDSTEAPTTIMRRALTPSYASPEQIEGRPVTVATDVYSLGLVLYELVAGQLPHSKEADKFWSTVHEQPAPPGKRAILAEVSPREVAGDLDGIVLRAIQKEPQERYASVEQFAADIQRFREGRPVLARRASRLYVCGRFLRRNRLQVAAVCLAAAALVATTGVAVWKWRAADRNLSQAQRDYSVLRAFAESVLSSVDTQTIASPLETERRMSETVTRYLDQLAKGRQSDEELQLQIASAYIRLGLTQGEITHANQGEQTVALMNFKKAYQISSKQWRSRADRTSGLRTLQAAYEIGQNQPDPAPAAVFLSSALEATRELLSRFPKDTEVLERLAIANGVLAIRLRYAGNFPASIEHFQTAIELADRALAINSNNPGAVSTQEGYTAELGNALASEGRLEEGLADINQAAQIADRAAQTSPSHHSRREAAFKLLARCETLRLMKRYAEARRDAAETIARLQSIANDDPGDDQAKADLAHAYFRAGNIEFDRGRIASALEMHREALGLREEQYFRHPSNLQVCRNYQASLTRIGGVLLAQNEDRLAAENLEQAVTLGQDLVKKIPSDVYAASQLANAYRGQATCALRAGRHAEAIESLRQAALIWRDVSRRAPLDVGLAAASLKSEGDLARELSNKF